jgi:adenylate cyclase
MIASVLLEEAGALPAASAVTRRAAVAFADLVGYTILMGAEPEDTHARWMLLLQGVLRPLARERGSTIVKSTGDGMVADFPTVADACDWARAVHATVAATDGPGKPPLAFRIAIAVGTIQATDDDIYGTCVNIAARLQEHAPPGGMAMTAAARAELDEPPPMDDLGTLRLRNIAEPVHAFALAPELPPRVPARAPVLGTPSIAVMPFDNPGGNPADLYFAAGIIEDIILSLGALSDLSVTARAATIGWAGGQHDPRIIGRVLGVRYVLSGSVRRGGGGLRLSAALREAEEGDLIWHEKFDISELELFGAQDAIVASAVGGIAPGIRAAELRRALRIKPDRLTAYDHTLRAMHVLDTLRRDSFDLAGAELHRAISEDPAFAMSVSWSSRWHSFAYGQGWTSDPAASADHWEVMACRAVQLDPRNAMGHAMSGHHRAYVRHDPAGALRHFDMALAACPNHVPSLGLKANSLSYLGRGDEALPLAEKALALCPIGPERFYYLGKIGMAHLARGDNEAAVRWLYRSLAENPQFNSTHRMLIAALHALGRIVEAREIAAQMLATEPDFRVSAYQHGRLPFVAPHLARQFLDALRGVGLPD